MNSEKIIPLTGADTHRYAPIHGGNESHSFAHTKPAPLYPSIRFDYVGRQWRLFKRSTAPDASWYFEFIRNGKKQGPWSMGTSASKVAIAEAKLRIDLWRANRENDLRRAMQRPDQRQWSTFRDVFARVHDLAIGARTHNARQCYVWGTRFVFRIALGLDKPDDVDAKSAGLLDRAHGELFFDRARAEANKLPSQAEQNTFMRTCNQAFTFAAALFTPKAVRSMTRDLKLSIPDTTEAFRKCYQTDRLDASDASEFKRPAEDVLRRTLVEWVRLGRTPGYVITSPETKKPAPLLEIHRRNMFIAVGLELAFGLRKGELKRVKWSWFDHIEGVPMLRCQMVDVKGGTNEINVVALHPFWTIMNRVIDRNGWRGAPDEYCLAERPRSHARTSTGLLHPVGGQGDRTAHPADNVSSWLRGLGWTTQKTNHALRDYGASLITMKYGLDSASHWCRHASRTTTEGHYQRFVELGKMASPRKLAWIRWAR